MEFSSLVSHFALLVLCEMENEHGKLNNMQFDGHLRPVVNIFRYRTVYAATGLEVNVCAIS